MNKKLILGLAMVMVLAGGAFLNVNAERASAPYNINPVCWSFACGNAAHTDMDKPGSTLITPEIFGGLGL